MSRRAQVEGVGILEFPDDTTDEVIASTVKRITSGRQSENTQQQQPVAMEPKPSVWDQVKNVGAQWGSATVRPVAKGIAGLVSLPADLATMAYNAGASFTDPYEVTINGKKEMRQAGNLPMLSGQLDELLDRYTRTPTDTIGKGSELVSSILAGGAMPNPLTAARASQSAANMLPNSAAAQVIKEGEKHAVPVFFDDVTRSALAKRIGVAAESLGDLGTGGGRAVQADAAKAAAERVTKSLVTGEGDDIPVQVQQGLKRQLGTFRKTAGKLYDKVSEQLDPHGFVPTPSFNRVLNEARNEQQKLGTLANKDVAMILEKYKHAPGLDFSMNRLLRSQLGGEISEYYAGRNTTIGKPGAELAQRLKDALEQDMGGFAKKIGGVAEKAWRTADGFYKRNIVPFKEPGFNQLVKTGEPEKAWSYLLAQGGLKSRAARMYNSLDEGGRATVRYGLVKDAYENAVSPKGAFSPAKFSKYLEDHSDTVKTFFKGNDLAEIKGFQNLMRHVERAGQYAENPPTGQRLILPLLFGSAAVSPKIAGAAAASGAGARLLFQTKKGRDLLLRMANAKPGSTLANTLSELIRKNLISGAAQVQQEQRPRAELAAVSIPE